jgi:cobalt-precorrin 5A hydrolase
MGGGEAMVIAGIGCRRGCGAADIVAVLREAERLSGRHAERLAAPAFKRGEAALHEAAALLRLDLVFVDEARLIAVQPRCATQSAAAERAIGLTSVAEACALAEAGPAAQLILPRVASRTATVALAEESA